MRGGTIHGRTSFVLLCNDSTKRKDSGQLLTLYFTLTQIFSGGKARIYLHTMLQLTVFMPISCPMRSRRHLVFLDFVTSTFARHSLNARNVINWELNFEENKIKSTKMNE